MEPPGALSDFDWNFVDESELMMAQLLDANGGIEPMLCPDHNDASSCEYWLHSSVASSLCWPIADTTSTGSFFSPPPPPAPAELVMIPTMETSSESMNVYLSEEQTTTSTLPVDHINVHFDGASNNSLEDYCAASPAAIIAEHTTTPQRKRKVVKCGIGNGGETMNENPKKKARTSTQVQKSAKNVRSKKAQKSTAVDEKEESNAGYGSEDNSNASQEPIDDGEGTSSNIQGKITRPSRRGSATDPQSLYARKRRERINERLKILQNLVPNGTKVDISTMLEEAVQYVKFLQLQIKLLSSDDMWMYAPLAYNGMDIGLDLKLPFPQQRQ